MNLLVTKIPKLVNVSTKAPSKPKKLSYMYYNFSINVMSEIFVNRWRFNSIVLDTMFIFLSAFGQFRLFRRILLIFFSKLCTMTQFVTFTNSSFFASCEYYFSISLTIPIRTRKEKSVATQFTLTMKMRTCMYIFFCVISLCISLHY